MKPTISADNSMTFMENQHGNEVLENLRQQRDLERCCDVILHVSGKQFHAHRCVLSACSPFFNSIFKAGKIIKEQLTISCESCDIFNDLLAYMYSGIIQVNTENVAELLKLANKFHIRQLKEHCADYLERYLNSSNCLTVLEMATKFSLEHLQNITQTYIQKNMNEIIKGEEVLYLALPKLEIFLKSPYWCITNEEILSLITSWVYHNVSSREISYRSLLTWITWQQIYPQVVTRLIKGHPLFSVSVMCLSFILDVLDDHQLLKEPVYESLSGLKETCNQDIRTVDDSDKFLNLAISAAINELKDDHTFLPRDKNLDSLSLFNETNVDRYFLEKDFSFRNDFIPQDIQNFETEHIKIDQQVLSRGSKLQQGTSNYLMNNDKPKDSYSDYCSDYYNYPTELSLGIDVLTEYERRPTLTESSEVFEKSSDKASANSVLSSEKHITAAEQNMSPVIQNCCHYSHENSENCPAITNKKSYMNHKYQVNHPASNSDLTIPKKMYPVNYKTLQLQTTDDFTNITAREVLDDAVFTRLEDSGKSSLPINRSAGFDRYDSFYNMKVDNLANISTTVMPVDSLRNNLGNDCNYYDEELHNLYNGEYGGAAYCGPERDPSEYEIRANSHTDIMFSESSQDSSNPKDMSLTSLRLPDTLELKEIAESRYHEYDSTIQDLSVTTIDEGREALSDKEPENIKIEPYSEVDKGSQEIETVHGSCKFNDTVPDKQETNDIQSQADREQLISTDSQHISTTAKDKYEKIMEGSKQTMKQKVMQKYREGRRKNNGKSSSEEEGPAPTERVSTPEVCNTAKHLKCSRKLNKVKNPQNKVKNNHNKAEPVKVCELCDQSFDRKIAYFGHMREHFPGPPHQCDICSSSFKRIYHLLDHRLIHSDAKPLKCSHCSYTTRKACNLKDHMTRHTDMKPLECGECGEKFYRKQHLEMHYTKHSDERPFVCETCEWTGKTKASLLLHSKVHKGDLYSCQYSDCAYRTAKLCHLKEHMQYHTKSRPFSCETCGMSFKTESHQRRHKLKHETSNRWQCSHCDFTTTRRDALKVHIKRKHSATKQPGLIKSRKQQLKKKDAMIPKNNSVDPYVQPRQLDLHNQQLNPFSDTEDNPAPCLNSALPNTSQTYLSSYPTETSTPSSCTFEAPSGDPDDALMIVSEMEDDEHQQSLTSYCHSSYLEPSIGESLVADESHNQYALPFKNSFPYSISNMDYSETTFN